jgi:hypothetical protein
VKGRFAKEFPCSISAQFAAYEGVGLWAEWRRF